MDDELAREAGELLLALGWKLAVAESCTGGLLGHLITEVPGSSAYFLGGVIAYAYEVKQSMLGVRLETLERHGAVSEETAREMADGVRTRLGAQVGVAITGVAGPGGGTADKPVGLTWLAVSTEDGTRAEKRLWKGDRSANKAQSAQAALTLLNDVLKEAKAGISDGKG